MSGQPTTTVERVNATPTATRIPFARKRPAAYALALNVNETALSTQEPSGLPTSSSPESSSYLSDDDIDSRKRRRHDSTISTLSDESDSQLSNICYTPSCSAPRCSKEAPFNNGEIIGEYKVVGSGYEARAVHIYSNDVYDCKILNDSQTETLMKLISRLDQASSYYHSNDINDLRSMIIPDDAEMVEEFNGRYVYFSPVSPRTLHHYAEQRGVEMSELEIQPIFEQIIRVVTFCHKIGIIVRELKPKKIGLSKNGMVRISQPWDLLVLDSPSIDTIKEKFKGSPAYAPPEVLSTNEEGYSGRAADMWGLGVLLYLLLLGRYPFYDKTPVGVFQKIKQARVVVPSNASITRHVRLLLFSLLRKQPSARPSAEHVKYMEWFGAKPVPSRANCHRVQASITLEVLSGSEGTRGPTARIVEYNSARELARERVGSSQSPAVRLGVLQSLFQASSSRLENAELVRII